MKKRVVFLAFMVIFYGLMVGSVFGPSDKAEFLQGRGTMITYQNSVEKLAYDDPFGPLTVTTLG